MYHGRELETMPSNLQVGAPSSPSAAAVDVDANVDVDVDVHADLVCVDVCEQVMSELEVEYETVPGWNHSIAHCRKFEELPPQAQVRGADFSCHHHYHSSSSLSSSFMLSSPGSSSSPPPHPPPPYSAPQAYVRRIEELIGVPVRWIGVGPGRLDVIDRGERFTLLREVR
jgi:hypothetical protein